ncbi:TonB-dependent receptor [Massilia sp. CFBP9012]|uniref:TonB-dependent receptor n=1 Tax=Massilia sp. CFBP9012 TaxID=3096531 RepID=UPI002A6B4755|nr:TonB-dependent receptor [Massilia sp. CFBP9012]MDY0975120.1 TonB-dependent receptor [Massilia sp. CFBP9012]
MSRHTVMHCRTRRLSGAVAMALASLATGVPVHAQQAGQTEQDSTTSSPASAPTTVRVVGTRQAQESAIGRKKQADTAQDSIVAEDVGAFPDRNVADAISRIAGVAVDRGDYGEGISVSIRGNGPELTRVELDGQGVQSAGGADLLGGMNAGSDQAGGRAVEMRQLSSDLIKSVDVVKGSTADMVEGALGGSVRITTRNGLDFKKDYLSMRVAGMQNTLNEKLNPNLNLVGVKKLMNDRLGVLVNLSRSKVAHESHSINQGGSSNAVGAYRPLDFDNSPEKTFSFQPGTVKLDDPLSTTPLLTSNLIGGGTFNAATPQEIVARSAAAQTKAACYQAFPLLSEAQANAIVAGATRTSAINQRQTELLSCLGQWNDYVPSSTRYFVNRQDEDRNSGDIRLDFKVSDGLQVYVKHSRSSRNIVSEASSAGYGGPAFNGTAVTGPNGYIGPSFTDTVSPTQLPNGAWATRNVVPASGYFLYPDLSWRGGGAANGSTSNIDPNSVTVDANHHLTGYTIADGGFGVENTMLNIREKSRYTQAGGTYKNRYVFAELLLGDARSDFSRYERRAGMSGYTGPVQANLLSNGIWDYKPTTSFDPNNPNNYFALRPQPALAAFAGNAFGPATPAYTADQLPLIDPARTLSLQNARINEQTERTVKLDVAFNTSDFTNGYLPRFKVGYNRRKSDYSAWGTGGMTVQEPQGTWGTPGYIPGIYVPNKNLRTTYQICEDTPGSLGPGGRPCKYGYTPNADPRANLGGTIQITADQFRDMFAQVYTKQPTSQFYGGDPDRPAGLIGGWTEIDIGKLYELLGVPNYNLDCVKSCAGSDGQMYAQPMNKLVETVDAGYLMTDFSLDRIPFSERPLPFGIAFDGNVGVRIVRTGVVGTGQLAFQSTVKNPSFNPADPENANGVTTAIYRRDTEISDVSTDYLPSINLNTWFLPNELVLRYNWGKTVARPPGGRLIPSGTCFYDERFTDQLDADGEPRAQYCSGTMGNPSLEPMTNHNQNLSLEWYPNKNYMLAGAVYRQEGVIGAPTLIEAVNAAALFAGSNQVDSQTGKPLADQQFDYRRWINQLPNTRTGYELSGKAAFTFLPWYLRYLGMDANYTRNKSKLTGTAVRDLLTGTVMPVAGEPHHSWNASLWYDDGKLSARVAVQFVAEKFSCISGCNSTAINNYPAQGLTTVRNPVYAPGAPSFRLGTRYIDAKIGYRVNENIELFLEGRNLGRIHTGTTTGGFAQFADGTPNVYTDAYAGATYMAGVNFRFE